MTTTLQTFRSLPRIVTRGVLSAFWEVESNIFSLKPLDFGNAKLLESPSQQGEALYPLKP